MVTLWMLGLSLLLLTLGGLSVDLWRGLGQRQSLASVAEAAALAGASGVDVAAFRSASGDPAAALVLDEVAARALAARSVETNADTPGLTGHQVSVTPRLITVTVDGELSLTLLRLLPLGADVLPVTVTASAEPRVIN